MVLGIKPSVPISLDKHTQLQQLTNFQQQKIFRYQSSGPDALPLSQDPNALAPLGSDDLDAHRLRRAPRRIAKAPYKVRRVIDVTDRSVTMVCVAVPNNQVLDAPALQDDFYLNLVDWSSNNILAVGLGACVYLWNANTSTVWHDPDHSMSIAKRA